MDELRVSAPRAAASQTRVEVDPANRGEIRVRHGAPVGRVCHIDIGSLGSPLSRSKDLSCLVIRADTRQVDRVGCCPNATIAKAEPVKIIFSSCPIHPGCTIEVIFGEETEGRIPFPDPALKRDAERDFQELVPIGVNHLGGQDSGHLGIAARLNVTRRRTSSGPEMADRSIDGPAPSTRSLPSRTPRPGLKRGVLTFLIIFVLAVSGIATAGVLAGAKDDKDEQAESNEQDDGAHGGPIERFHTAGSCDLTAVSSLPGNWTHGEYVSAVAANGNAAQIREAAHSDCGKPMMAVGHGGGPPEHALEHMAAGKAHAAGKAEDEGSGTPGASRRVLPEESDPPRSRFGVSSSAKPSPTPRTHADRLTNSRFADTVGLLEVGKHQDVEQLGAGSGTEASRRAWSRCSRSSGRIMCLPSPITPRGRGHGGSKASRLSFEREGRQSGVPRLSCKRFLLRRAPQEQTMVRGTVRFKNGYRA
jgi:hypothetical protein